MSLAACADLVRRADPDRFLAAMAAPVPARAVLFPLYALNVEIARAPYMSDEPMIAEMRLQWWRDAVDEIVAGKPPRAHEVVQPLAALIRDHALPPEMLDQMIAARRWDIWRDPFEDEAAFRAHLDTTSGHLMWLGALALGAPAQLQAPVRQVGYAMGLANWLRAVPELEGRGRLPLPDGRVQAIADLARDGLAALKAARRAPMDAAIPALRAAWQTRAILKQAVAAPARVASGTLGTSEFRRRAGLMALAARGRW